MRARGSRVAIVAVIAVSLLLITSTSAKSWSWDKKTKELSEDELKKIKAELNILEDPRFRSYSDSDLREVLDKEIDSQEVPGLTYGVFILNAIYEEKLVEMCYPDFRDEESSRFFSLLADNLTSWQKNFAEKTTKIAIKAIIEAYKMHGLSIGISSLFLAVDLAQIGVGIIKLAEVVRNRALSCYMGARGRGDSHEVAWSVAGIPPLYDNWQTQEFFKSLWNKYGKYMSEDGLDKDFEQQEREKLRTSFLHGLGVRAHPVITSPLKISPSPPYHAGDRINAEFTITNKGTVPITFNILTVGGRDPDGQVADFTFRRDITLSPNKSYDYKGSLTLAKAGNYHFFCAYQTPDGNWNPSVDLGPGLTEEDRIEDILVTLNNVALGKPCTVITNGAEDYSDGHPGEWPRDITDGRLAYQPVSSGKEDGCIAWQNEDHDELLVVTVTIDLGATHNITKIRYNPGNCERAETWNADIMESLFGKTPTNPGSPYRGTWTEQTGSITTSKVTIKLEKTRRSWATDWLFIGEIEVWGTSIE